MSKTTTEAAIENGPSKSVGKKETTTVALPQATVGETLSFVFECGPKMTWIFFAGVLGGIGNGFVYPILAFMFSTAFTDIAGATTNGIGQVRELAYTFMIIGVYALCVGFVQTWSFEIVAHNATQNLRLKWFSALLRQDAAFFDVYDASGIAGQIGPSTIKYRRGLGRKFGEGIQFFVTGVGGLGFAMWSSWRTALVVLGLVPLIAVCALAVMQLNQSKGTRGAAAYKTAGSVAYTTVSAIKTVLSLNAISTMVQKYSAATQEAYVHATGILIKQGAANGGMLGSFLLLYCILALYGTALLYLDVRKNGCDPSGISSDVDTCTSDGAGVFGAMLGVAFSAQGASQFGSFAEAFTQARVAAYIALQVIRRRPGAPEETIFRKPEDEVDGALSSTTHSKKSSAIVSSHAANEAESNAVDQPEVKAVLPKYEIDSTSDTGAKPENIKGCISFKEVTFAYPTRPHEVVLNQMSTEIEAGQTVAFVGPSGSGKSTVVAMLERFYDPKSGSIELDGINVKDINVGHLRSAIGYVGQEPTLFATSIRANIQYGNPQATFEQIQEAARLANAHDFISAFSDGYDTQVGDKGSQLSGGQKQRIAIARVLVGKPRILILDEATSALDSESELVVQEALDNILESQKITTVIIAHRLSTIRGCDTINVLRNGVIVESGTHVDLMEKTGYYYELVMKQDGGMGSKPDSSVDLTELGNNTTTKTAESEKKTGLYPHISFKNVIFSYPTRPKKVIFDEFSLDIELGSTVALVGPSGGGKSTTVGLIERFYDPLQGTVSYEGTDIKTLNVHWYRDQIGYVGQEPTLFNDTIANNIAYGAPLASRREIEDAAKQANAYDFIMEFSDGFDTLVGERGAQLSGGQKQRVAIARALVKKPRILILDEATSALDTHSEAVVQEAIDKLMSSRDQTCIVIAHRLSTIKSADKIAFIANGKVLEEGTHDELIVKPHGRYKRLFDSSRRETTMTTAKLKDSQTTDKSEKNEGEIDEDIDWESKFQVEEVKAFSASRARKLAAPDTSFMIIGAFGALMAGSVFPLWGLLFSETIDLLFRPIFKCTGAVDETPICPDLPNLVCVQYETCDEYWNTSADMMQNDSFYLSLYWTLVLVGCIVGNVLLFWGFGMASERLNKRVRDSAFSSLVRQEVAFFDKRSVGSITSQLQDDAARLQAFSGEPIRSMLTAMSAVIIGVTLSFIFMWPFALLAIGCIPIMGFATSIEMKQMLGEDEGTGEKKEDDNNNSPGGVLVETLLNMRTVSALTLEQQRYNDYERALINSEPNIATVLLTTGITGGISMFIQQWINALQLWFGGWLLVKFPERYEFRDFLISNFAVLFALFGLGAAFQDISDRKEVEKSAGRIFYLLDRVSEIDPLGKDGIILGEDTIHAKRSKFTKSMDDTRGDAPKTTNSTTTPNETAVPPSKEPMYEV